MNKFLRPLLRAVRPTAADEKSATAASWPPVRAGVRFVPGEDVLLLTIALPPLAAARRRVAAAFAIEDQIARPLERVQVALGPQLAPDRWLVGVADLAALPADLGPGLRLLPDTLALPVPPQGVWAVAEAGGRIAIRLPDATGMVARAHSLPVLHQIAGAPAITLYAGNIALDHQRAVLPTVALPAGFDLAAHRGSALGLPPLARRLLANRPLTLRLLAIAAATAIGHIAILATETAILSRQHAALEARLRSLSGVSAQISTDALLARILAPPPPAAQAAFLPLLGATFAAAAGQAGEVSLRELRFDAAARSLTLTLQATDLGTLQQMETDLAGASLAGGQLAVTSGPATVANGTAEQQMVVVQGDPG